MPMDEWEKTASEEFYRRKESYIKKYGDRKISEIHWFDSPSCIIQYLRDFVVDEVRNKFPDYFK